MNELEAGQRRAPPSPRGVAVTTRPAPRLLLLSFYSVLVFKRGSTKLTDDLREGRSSAATTEDDISAVRLMIEPDKKVTF
ncbi:hypothetical protein EVAR_36090_1 [Eumeta japonica]|uniref:Uncharacterized protein n=1 Tax=Eumeta variegata TaxID=151549 RepID=A0A4C1YKN7_EUMVA|nr:hypothetical protein EVAR_36090_1 [Eumeta japonica]